MAAVFTVERRFATAFATAGSFRSVAIRSVQAAVGCLGERGAFVICPDTSPHPSAAAGIAVSVCGEMASDPHYAKLLVGLGLRRLSMSPRLVPHIKTLLRDESAGALRELAERCFALRTAEEIEACLRAPYPVRRVEAELR